MKKIIFFLFYFSSFIYPQEEISFDLIKASLENSALLVKDIQDNIIYTHMFHNPTASAYDLDDDGINELLLQDITEENGKSSYTIFIYNTIDSFYLVDSIFSGCMEPYRLLSEELGSPIIIAGNCRFETFIINDNHFLPVDCWKYEGGELYLVNDEVSDIFLAENEAIIEFIEDYYSFNIKNCSTSQMIKSAIVSVYINFINAGEKSVASQFIKTYYLCGDADQFINELQVISQHKED